MLLLVLRRFEFFYGGGQFGYYFECVSNDAIVGGFEEGRFGIFVDHYDGFGAIYPSEVLDGA